MKKNLSILLFLFSTPIVFSQPEEAVRMGIDSVLSPRDSLRALIVHDPGLDRIDSLWRQELYRPELFEEFYHALTETNAETPVIFEELPTELLKERLAALDARTPFDVTYNPILENVIKSYLKNRKKSLQRLMYLTRYYFPQFEAELDRQGLPLEMKYLAVVESALQPQAKSRMGATGLWQFMYATGKMMGLEITSYIDERSDPDKATVAACEYLLSLHRTFDDWDLALAAYNSGPGNVSKALRRAGGYTNYWNIRHFLPRETAGYLPAFLATMYIFEYAEEHGFEIQSTETAYGITDTVHVKQAVAFDQLSELLGMDLETLRFLNPAYKRDKIPYVAGKQYALRLPVSQLALFASNEAHIYAYLNLNEQDKEMPEEKFLKEDQRVVYRVRSGDYLGKIANRYGVRVSDIKSWNSLRSNNLQIGQRLTLYPNRQAASTASTSQGEREYIVQRGDSLWSIARKFPGVSVANLKQWNSLSGTGLKPGMKLKVRG